MAGAEYNRAGARVFRHNAGDTIGNGAYGASHGRPGGRAATVKLFLVD